MMRCSRTEKRLKKRGNKTLISSSISQRFMSEMVIHSIPRKSEEELKRGSNNVRTVTRSKKWLSK